MMNRPRHTLRFGGKDYDVEGSFGLIDAVEYALKEDSVRLTARVTEIPLRDLATLLHAVLSHYGHKITREKAGQALFDMGASSEEVAVLRVHLYVFLRICLSSPKERQEVESEMGELIARYASPGDGTGDSVSAPSAGLPENSGKQASGMRTRPTKATPKPKA